MWGEPRRYQLSYRANTKKNATQAIGVITSPPEPILPRGDKYSYLGAAFGALVSYLLLNL